MYIVSTYILNHIKQKRLQAIANRGYINVQLN